MGRRVRGGRGGADEGDTVPLEFCRGIPTGQPGIEHVNHYMYTCMDSLHVYTLVSM